MYDTVLFLGFPLSQNYQNEILKLSHAERELFIQNQASPYLQQIQFDGIVYLGKCLGITIEMSALEASYFHIYSLLKKLVPQFVYEENALFLLAIPSQICLS